MNKLWVWPAVVALCLFYWAAEVFVTHRWLLLAGLVIGTAIGLVAGRSCLA